MQRRNVILLLSAYADSTHAQSVWMINYLSADKSEDISWICGWSPSTVSAVKMKRSDIVIPDRQVQISCDELAICLADGCWPGWCSHEIAAEVMTATWRMGIGGWVTFLAPSYPGHEECRERHHMVSLPPPGGQDMMSSLVNSVHDLTAWCGMTSSQDLSTGKQSRYNKICNLESFWNCCNKVYWNPILLDG